jgi:translation initiation factor IF-2
MFPISAVTGKGIAELKFAMAEKVENLREESLQSPEDSRQSSVASHQEDL